MGQRTCPTASLRRPFHLGRILYANVAYGNRDGQCEMMSIRGDVLI